MDIIESTIERFKQENINYRLCSPEIKHFHAYDINGLVQQFWAGTGTIMFTGGYTILRDGRLRLTYSKLEQRGLDAFIEILKGKC